jgi:D-alanyl-D-alanine carboxypeptidase
MRFRDRLLLLSPMLLAIACADAADAGDAHEELATTREDLVRPRGPLADALAGIVAAGPPAALAFVRKGSRTSWSAAGVANRETQRAPRPDDRFRIASVTKPFSAVVVLQLESEGKLRLDDRVARYLPGLLPESMPVTIRQLLQHTSGLADYHDYDGFYTAADYDVRRFEDPSAADSLALALPHSPLFPPGTGRHYTDTNYRVLELLVPAITGRSIAREIRRRILVPLGLDATSYPEADPEIRGSHLHGYLASDLPDEPFGDQSKLIDMTVESIDQTGAAGALISNGHDLLRFFRALVAGKLLPEAQLAAMMQTVPVDAEEAAAGATGYGLGLVRWDLGCGTYWGHIGSIRGYTTLAYAAEDGSREAVLEITQSRLPAASLGPILEAASRAVCGE